MDTLKPVVLSGADRTDSSRTVYVQLHEAGKHSFYAVTRNRQGGQYHVGPIAKCRVFYPVLYCGTSEEMWEEIEQKVADRAIEQLGAAADLQVTMGA